MSDVALYQAPSLLVPQTDSWVAVLADVARLAEQIAQTDFVPRALRGNPPAIAATMLYGRECGLAPMQSLRAIHIIDGRPAMSAESMRGLILAAGHSIEYVSADSTRCRVRGRRRGESAWHEVEWTIESARAAGLASRGPWRTYPRQMLKARATAELARDAFADVIGGFVALEELDRVPEAPQTPVEAPASNTRVVARGEAPTPRTRAPRATSTPSAAFGQDNRVPEAPKATPVADDAPGDHGDWADVPLPIEPEPPSEAPPAPPRDPSESASQEQGRLVFRLLNLLGIETRPERLDVAAALIGRRVESFAELTRGDAHSMIETLNVLHAAVDGRAQLDALVAHWKGAEPLDVDPETGEVLGDDAPPY